MPQETDGAQPPRSTSSKMPLMGTFIMAFGIIAAIGTVTILWGDSRNKPGVVFVGLIILSISVIAWLPALGLLLYWMGKDFRDFVHNWVWPWISKRFSNRRGNNVSDGDHDRGSDINPE